MTNDSTSTFDSLGLKPELLKTLHALGYEKPSPIQAQVIPLMLKGGDLLGQAPTGTGKTAAFALPVISSLDFKESNPQALVLVPTRELAIQVSEAFHQFARRFKGFHALPIYGGQDYRTQIRSVQRGVQVIIGVPGRVMDHVRRGTLVLESVNTVVLDEADELLRMGFTDDVEWILKRVPKNRQLALFSATQSAKLRRIAAGHLDDSKRVTITASKGMSSAIRQHYWPIPDFYKLDALTRILEAEPIDGMLVFVRTRLAADELSGKLEARGFASAALNADMSQRQRDNTIARLKKGSLDMLVATDMAARNLDISRISHVVHYDMPTDIESYVQRNGRAGREGRAILLVTPLEKHLLYAIEGATEKKIALLELPSTDEINHQRISKFKHRVTETLKSEDLGLFIRLIEEYQGERDVPALHIAAALAQLSQGDAPFLLQSKPHHTFRQDWRFETAPRRRERTVTGGRSRRTPPVLGKPDQRKAKGMERFRLAVGRDHGVMPGHIIGLLAKEARINKRHIGRVSIHDRHSFVDLPHGMPDETFRILKKTRVAGRELDINRLDEINQGKRIRSSTVNPVKARLIRAAKRKPHRRRR